MTLPVIILFAQAAATVQPTVPIVAPPAPPPAPIIRTERSHPRSAVPISNPGEWVQTNDYPSEALVEEKEGVVGFTVGVDTFGRVKSCRITASSGTPSLDEATCRLVTLRARFATATDASGKPIEGTYTNRVRWVIPVPPAPVPGKIVVSFIVQPDGQATDCKAEVEGQGPDGPPPPEQLCSKPLKFEPYRDTQQRPIARKVTTTMSVTVE